MSSKHQQVAKATETREPMTYDVFNLTEKQSDKIDGIINKHLSALKKSGNQCDFMKAILDELTDNDEKLFAMYSAGQMSVASNNPFGSLFSGN